MLEKPLYTTAISAFGAGIRVASLKNHKAKLLARGHKEIRERLEKGIDPQSRYIWIHAASLGEFEQGRPLIEKIKKEKPEYKILLTFFSPSGYEVRKNYSGADCVCYLPLDTPRRVNRFLDKVRPEMAIFVKYEFWRNYLHALWQRQIPTYLISAVFRPDQAFFKKSMAWYALWLKWYTRIFVQDERSRDLLRMINVENVDVFGDTRFDRVCDIKANGKRIHELEAFTESDNPERKPVMMAGSSWPQDEAVYGEWFNDHPEVKLVVAPHEFDSARLAELKKLFRNGAVLMSEVQKDPQLMAGQQVLIMDCFGLLSSAYAYCDVAYVGGGFGAGLHNINEAAVYDVPVIYGPNNAKFIEAREMAESGGGLPIASKEEFAEVADKLLISGSEERKRRGEQAGNYIRSKLGATDKIFARIFALKK
ncbi:MAG: 3-deoxy-D-manno-octulosonic acid transferase [Muribaculaceae bacterium]|nr:3-deoxy-D-manno-octulosonic acid transferase [Muribaculaceae bacterium]